MEVQKEKVLRKVPCKFCGVKVDKDKALRHLGKWVCKSCWDERLTITE